jgi:hypothetical protein
MKPHSEEGLVTIHNTHRTETLPECIRQIIDRVRSFYATSMPASKFLNLIIFWANHIQ